MRIITRASIKLARLLLSRPRAERLIARLAYLTGVNLMELAHRVSGVGCWENMAVSGEQFFLARILPDVLRMAKREAPVFFDVGANKGEYCLLLRSSFPEADIHAFEPNPSAFAKLKQATEAAHIHAVNVGMSSEPGRMRLSFPKDNPASSHGTLYADVHTRIHRVSEGIAFQEVELRTVTDYCREAGITGVDFMKIDTEGHEYAVLQGSQELLQRGAFRLIQFEFNQMNVMSRVFLKDFYDLLGEGYVFFRLSEHELIPLEGYNTRNEIFIFQNIIAVWRPLAEAETFRRYVRR